VAEGREARRQENPRAAVRAINAGRSVGFQETVATEICRYRSQIGSENHRATQEADRQAAAGPRVHGQSAQDTRDQQRASGVLRQAAGDHHV